MDKHKLLYPLISHDDENIVYDNTLITTNSDNRDIDSINTDNDNKVIGTAFSSNPWSPLNVTKPEMHFHINMTDFSCTLPETKQHQNSIILNQLSSLNFETT